MKEPPLVHCPNCNTDSLVRVLGGGSGLIFKGSGFYLTDYKRGSSPQSEKKEKPPEDKNDTDKK
jgi:predicted nucleic acid-binding Zn ribbon protein